MASTRSQPVTRYAQSDDVSLAYRVYGDGARDLVCVPGLVSHIEFFHELPGYSQWIDALASFARVITFDKRGQGLSDRTATAPSVQDRMDDIRAVMDAVGIERADLLGISEGASISVVFAVTYPERVRTLTLFGGFAKMTRAPDYPHMLPGEDYLKQVKYWGGGGSIKSIMQTRADDAGLRELWAQGERLCVSPGAFRMMIEANNSIDVREFLSQIQVPTLVLHRITDRPVSIENGRYLAEHIPGARLIEYPTGGHHPLDGDYNELARDISQFVTGQREVAVEFDRVLSTVLMTDIVGSTERLAELGDHQWSAFLSAHDDAIQTLVRDHRGRYVKSTGDGALATFDGPGRALACARGIADKVDGLGAKVRAGVHTGEIELRGNDIGGLAVHVAARVVDLADAGEVLATKVVTDLVAGSSLSFAEKGAYALKGVTGEWPLFALR